MPKETFTETWQVHQLQLQVHQKVLRSLRSLIYSLPSHAFEAGAALAKIEIT